MANASNTAKDKLSNEDGSSNARAPDIHSYFLFPKQNHGI